MKKLILSSVSAIALFGVAACSDTDTTTTQSVEPDAQVIVPTDPTTPTPQAMPEDSVPPAGEVAPAE